MKQPTDFSHRRRHAYWATAIVTAATLLALAVNAGAIWLEDAFDLRADVSAEQYTALTDESQTLLGDLKKNIYLYYIGSAETGDLRVTELLKRYASLSKRVSYHTVDPASHPGFSRLFDPEEAGIAEKSVIISDSDGLTGEQPTRYKVLPPDEFYVSSAPYYDDAGDLVSDDSCFAAEQKISSAIDYIVTEKTLSALFLTGHHEKEPCSALLEDLGASFFDTQGFDFSKPADPKSQTLIVIDPKKDLSENEYATLSVFLEQGGKAVFFIDSITTNPETGEPVVHTQALHRFGALLSAYGITVDHNVIVGGSPATTYMSRTSLIPSLSVESPITKPLADARLRPVLCYASPIFIEPLPDVTVSVLLETDAMSYAKKPEKSLASFGKESSDKQGPFAVGVLARKGSSAIAVFSSSSFVATEDSYLGNAGNAQLFLNTISSLNHRMEMGGIGTRTVYSASDTAYKLDISSEMEKLLYIVLAAGVLPLVVLFFGIARWLRRRHL